MARIFIIFFLFNVAFNLPLKSTAIAINPVSNQSNPSNKPPAKLSVNTKPQQKASSAPTQTQDSAKVNILMKDLTGPKNSPNAKAKGSKTQPTPVASVNGKKILSLERMKKFKKTLIVFLRDFGIKFNVTKKIYKELDAKFLKMNSEKKTTADAVRKSEKSARLNEKWQKHLRDISRDHKILSENLKNAFLKKSLMEEVSKINLSLASRIDAAIQGKISAGQSLTQYYKIKKNKSLSKIVELKSLANKLNTKKKASHQFEMYQTAKTLWRQQVSK